VAAVAAVAAVVAPPSLRAQAGIALAEPGVPIQLPSPARLAARRARLLDQIGSGLAILRSASEKSIEGDYPQDSDFRQENDFFYLTGVETPDSWLALGRSGDRSISVLFIPKRNPAREQWTGRKPSFEEAAATSGIADVRASGEFEEFLSEQGAEFAAHALFAPIDRHTRCDTLIQRLAADSAAPGGAAHNVDPLVARLRLVKDDFELTMLRRAIEITADAQRAAMRTAEPGMYEYELESVIEFNFRRGGAERVGFPSIIGSGPNSVVLHYDKSRRKMEAGDLVVVDIGAEYSYYSADVTRTLPVSGRFTARQREIYNLVLASQQAGIDAVRPGVSVWDVGRAAREYMSAHSGDLCGERNCVQYFIHGTSHWLGMDVHDVGSYRTPLAPGMVLTVEPGIYLPEESLGVRIEDDVLVTAAGHEVLSAAAPRQPEEIEAEMARHVDLE